MRGITHTHKPNSPRVSHDNMDLVFLCYFRSLQIFNIYLLFFEMGEELCWSHDDPNPTHHQEKVRYTLDFTLIAGWSILLIRNLVLNHNVLGLITPVVVIANANCLQKKISEKNPKLQLPTSVNKNCLQICKCKLFHFWATYGRYYWLFSCSDPYKINCTVSLNKRLYGTIIVTS